MPSLFNGPPKIPSPPPTPAPVPMPVPDSANNAYASAQKAQTIAMTQATSGRASTDLTKGQGDKLGAG